MSRVVVTGGGGFIGSAIVRALLARGEEVVVVGRSHYPALASAGALCLRGDIADQAFVDQALRGAELVFHVAARAGIWGRWADYVHSNVEGTATVLRSCSRNRVPNLVYTSTPSVVFERHDLQGVDESTPYARRTLCHYAASKIIAEKMVLRANSPGLRTSAIRPHLVWGPGDPHLIPRLLDRGRSGRLKIVGNGRNLVDIAYIDNVVHAHLLAADNLRGDGRAAGRAFFIGQREPVVLWQWINSLFSGLGIAPVRKKIPFGVAYAAGVLLEGLHCGLALKQEPAMTRFVALQLARSHWFRHQAAREILGYQEQVSTDRGMAIVLKGL